MKSPEYMGGVPELPEEEPNMKEEKPNEPESQEQYDKAGWEKLKEGKVSTQIYLGGKEIGVPQEELNQFAKEVIARELEKKNYTFVYGFRQTTGIERVEPSEPYDEKEWEKLKQESGERPAFVIAKGYETGVPKDELNRFAESVIAKETANQEYSSVYRFRKNMGIGTEEEIKIAGEKAYQFFLEKENFGSAAAIAEEVYGRNSEEWKRAQEASEAEWKKTQAEEKRRGADAGDEEREVRVTLSKDATFADLFGAIEALEESEAEELHFEDELWDNFNPEVVEEILSFREGRTSEAGTTKLLDFLKERGYAQKDISTYLPIKFKRERKKKQ